MHNIPPNELRWKIPPLTLLAAALVFGLAAMAGVVALALAQPWSGLTLAPAPQGKGAVVLDTTGPASQVPPGTIIVRMAGNADSMELEARDLIIEPDGVIPDYDTYREFIARQNRLARIQQSDKLWLTSDKGQTFVLTPDANGRPLTEIPADFWVGLVVGLTAWLVSAGVFAFRPGDAGARYLLLSGAATLVFAPAAAIYTTRELAVDGTVFRWASDLNFFGGSLFAASFVALLLHYPRRLAPAWVGIGVVFSYIAWFVMQQMDVFESKIFARRFLVMVGVIATFILAGVHWLGTRKDPVARAALQWFLLSWVLGTGLFALFILLPQTFGVDTTPLQGYAFLLFLLVYGGLAFGILRYRLFELGEWWRRVVVWTISVLSLVLLDMFFLFGLHMSAGTSVALSLLIAGVVWLPLRTWAWGRFATRQDKHMGDMFSKVMDIALQPPGGGTRTRRWTELLASVFDPLHISRTDTAHPEVAIGQDGLVMTVPRIETLPALRLEFARGGRGLFTPRDAALATELATLMEHGIKSRAAYANGVAEERARIARDIHDNIGAQMLAALHSKDAASKDAKIRETLVDLRDVINDASAIHMTIDETLADLRLETADRLAASGIELEWTSEAGEGTHLDPAIIHAVRSIIREAVSNVIRHSKANRASIDVRCRSGLLTIEIADNGTGFDTGSIQDGHGVSNMQARLDGLRGNLILENTGSGMRLEMKIPIDENHQQDE